MSVLWPIDLRVDGYFYGWEKPFPCVSGVLRADSLEEARRHLSDAAESSQWAILRNEINVDMPTIMGRCNMSSTQAQLQAPSRDEPELEWYGNRTDHARKCIVYYKPPNRSSMQFYAFDSCELDILPSQVIANASSCHSLPATLSLRHDFTHPTPASPLTLDDTVLNHINAAQTLATFVTETLWEQHGQHDLQTTAQGSGAPASLQQRQAQPTSTALRSLITFLRDFSATVEQLDIRWEQASFLVCQAPFIVGRNKSRSIDSISRYVKFYNCIWLVLNDMIIGLAFGSFLCENSHVLGSMLDILSQYYLVESMQRTLIWLNSWPAGLKLNTELSQFYCHSLLAAITIWGRVLRSIGPYYPALFWIVGAAGSCGMTMIVSLLSDIIGLLTLHLHVCYVLSATAFRHELGLARSLWNLFRGKRFNVLRNRLDSWDYDIDQLLLGTILFTLVAFLYPTVLTYYALFASAHLAVIVLHGLLDTISALLNHFPLFALMLRVKDPMRFPGYLVFRRLGSGSLILEACLMFNAT
ncbi:Gpi1-domain-containing protein [Daedalea quercina L-15889]|uniref:Gpi1-domain-containing protein n=1 Tax=Daedalea quercina L-15889 TaxID=1314783 RepID=A0A165LHS0_9APHY|nr:Gpi1-domain-containing protein [Daedalea quercina L-15889]